jgi:hypothetical protein
MRRPRVLGILAAVLALTALLGAVPSPGLTASARAQPPTTYDRWWALISLAGPGPTVMSRRPTFELQPNTWTTEIGSFDVRVSRTSMTSSRPSRWEQPPGLQGLAPSTPPTDQRHAIFRIAMPVAQGQVLCLSARAHSTAGTLSPWTDPACVIRFVDDSRLIRRGPVTRLHDRRFWGGRATAIPAGSDLVLRHAPARSRVVVLTTEYPRYNRRDTVTVFQRGPRRMFLSFDTGRSKGRRPHFSRATTGGRLSARTGEVRLTTAGEVTVPVEGLAVLPIWARLAPSGVSPA